MSATLKAKPTVAKITVKRMLDTDPDLSYLGKYSDVKQGLSDGDFPIDRWEESREIKSSEYRYFIAANVENEKQAHENYSRMESYNNQNWCMLGIQAVAEVLIPDGNGYSTIQHIHSGGLWGIESDSDEFYFEEVEKQETDDVKSQLKALGIRVPKNVPVESVRE